MKRIQQLIINNPRVFKWAIIGIISVLCLIAIIVITAGFLCVNDKYLCFTESGESFVTESPKLKLRDVANAEECWNIHHGVCVSKHGEDTCPYSAEFRNCGEDEICCIPQGRKPQNRRSPSLKCGRIPRIRLRIVNGWQTRLWPFMVSLQLNGSHICGATIISPTFIITAAHCVQNKRAQDLSLVTGEDDFAVESGHEKEFKVAKISISSAGDLALLKVKAMIRMDRWRQPVCLPELADGFGSNSDHRSATDVCLALGWGSDGGGSFVNQLRATALYLINDERCQDLYRNKISLLPNQICALMKRTDTCTGDSGGPLLGKRGNNFILVGVGSTGHRLCAQLNKPSIFSKISNFLPWIRSLVKDLPSEE